MRNLTVPALALCIVSGFVLIGSAGLTAAEEQRLVSIGTGGVTGVYYPTGGAICRLVNSGREEHGVRCAVQSTDGSVYNINAIRQGELEFGVVQSDVQFYAHNGTSGFAEQGPFEKLRAVFSLYPEPFTVVARANLGIKTFADLAGKRVNIGNPGSGQRGTMDVVMAALGWNKSTFGLASEFKSAPQSQALCDDKIDVMVFTVGHPNGSIKEAAFSCDSVLVPVAGPEIDKLVEDKIYYRHASIPGGMYSGTDEDVETFGVGATFVTSADVPKDVVYDVVNAVFENFDQLKKLHPAFVNLKPKEMIKDWLSAPLHDGAVQYYREKSWM
jgi:TRAP transporter TAXI family solute receptor